ncbi:uncharacterized protein LY79DRAFT_667595 [Colletotrichum navitas]|uniref:Uncharacterized protein n=1 Tax=Colletotrichum navitas TaxID=681940 RepID=A0AAD8Q6M9_9PEZI|nr:uncharacterized protein LY79DRAFT_667595 [Colletotrichum navitas]KAK1596112.1 hypothetical protein LY79DRAFT_667595 [Colletotrichum navitas]
MIEIFASWRDIVDKVYDKMLQDAGFVDVEKRIVTWPFDAWPEDPKLKHMCFLGPEGSALASVEVVPMAISTSVLGQGQ